MVIVLNMKNNDIQSKEKDSPKTPGGISKSHLTSIRRLGLSRKWKKSGVSPFVSPLASNNITKSVDNSQEETKTRKRKLHLDEENIELSPLENTENVDDLATTPPVCKQVSNTNDSTPIRKVTRKKSRTIPYTEECSAITVNTNQDEQKVTEKNVSTISCEEKQNIQQVLPNQNTVQPVDILAKTEEICEPEIIPIEHVGENKLNETSNINNYKTVVNPEVPNKLVKECIVLIQNKILKKKENKSIKKTKTPCDSDDDIPLSNLNKITQENNTDSDFKIKESKPSPKIKPIKKTKSSSKKNSSNKKQDIKVNKEQLKSSQSSDEDDDFDMNKKTIYFPKNDKINKPVKSKSTGSITQKDIDELKARIEMKKQLLFAKAQNKDTEEVRNLIKKWRKGCQDALIELLELMRNKLPDRSDMNYSNILDMLKIPPAYVGYDPENDCFSTPDDNNILASIFNDL